MDCFYYYTHVQGQADSSDCDLTPHYTTTADGTLVSFKSATNDAGSIKVEEDGRITISTMTTEDNSDSDTHFRIVNVSVNS